MPGPASPERQTGQDVEPIGHHLGAIPHAASAMALPKDWRTKLEGSPAPVAGGFQKAMQDANCLRVPRHWARQHWHRAKDKRAQVDGIHLGMSHWKSGCGPAQGYWRVPAGLAPDGRRKADG